MDEVFLTGASGFVGGHVLQALLDAGFRVRALVRDPDADVDERVRLVSGDLRRCGKLATAMRGCRYLVHVAAAYSFSPRDRQAVWETNVAGTKGLLEAAHIAGVEKAVVTSSSAAVGPSHDGIPASEADHPHPSTRRDYHASKVEEEYVALSARVPTVLVLPTAPVGPGDARPTPTGRIVLDFVRGRMPAVVDGGMNLVPVEDVSRAHILALQLGSPGERYILGGEDMTFDDIWRTLARLTSRPVPRVRLSHSLVLAMAHIDEVRCRLIGGTPVVPLEGARMSAELMYASSARAARELGWWASPVEGALERAVNWYRRAGMAV
ncbi:MAG TPA: NAD-dependent epimerase/dehydratase family protein [Candidatus Dormibacteraeota bacterium]|nr:NAD-dependent epimerase/dehydratase family protein [Candidatus Dormibacteraeota bacterium]